MEPFDAFVIPVTTLRMGRNELDFTADWRFFERFESSPIQQGSFEIDVIFDRFQDHWHLVFEIEGKMDTECDRCLTPISLPVSGSHELYVKFDEGEPQEAEVINMPRETTQFDISQFVYEFIVLSVPMIKRFDCENEKPRPCDLEMLAKLSGHQRSEESASQWDALKQIRLSNEESN
jgi:uncharacterized metal-binding protein YceD (DUF177 family)